MPDLDATLAQEFTSLEGLHGQNLETGAGNGSGQSYLGQYTTRLFGAPYQLLDSVDRRFPSINKNVGSEYLRHFLLNSAILHIKPGMPQYTGMTDSNEIMDQVRFIYSNISTSGGMGFGEAVVGQLAKSTIFGVGKKLQKRMFGFRETYYEYIQHVNYMCRSVAAFLNLAGIGNLPTGTFISGNEFKDFKKMEWENYRMMGNSKMKKPTEYFSDMIGATPLGVVGGAVSGAVSGVGVGAKEALETLQEGLSDPAMAAAVAAGDWASVALGAGGAALDALGAGANAGFTELVSTVQDAYNEAKTNTMTSVMEGKICTVEFLVDPVPFTESYENSIGKSAIASLVDSPREAVGSEVQWFTNSNMDLNTIEKAMKDILGTTLEGAAGFLTKVTQGVAGGFVSNMISGALGSVKGQKMIYPDIYKNSDATRSYSFTIKLRTPYGDVYNYYMNIVVPLCHLLCLALPRMVTANSSTTPYLCQAYIPGMMTCDLGMIESMEITKNPDLDQVSVNGFPLAIDVKFTIRPLYTQLSISPANDPASFMYNDTLTDYMANMAGLVPSVNTFTEAFKNTWENFETYMAEGGAVQDLVEGINQNFENSFSAYVNGGS